MLLTIVKPDNLVMLDESPLNIDLDAYEHPDNLHALQWRDNERHIEFNDQPNQALTELPSWVNPIIEEHQRLTKQKLEEQEIADRQSVFTSNGQARKTRLQQKQQQQYQAESQSLKKDVDHLKHILITQ